MGVFRDRLWSARRIARLQAQYRDPLTALQFLQQEFLPVLKAHRVAMHISIRGALREHHFFNRRNAELVLHRFRNAVQPKLSTRWDAHSYRRGWEQEFS